MNKIISQIHSDFTTDPNYNPIYSSEIHSRITQTLLPSGTRKRFPNLWTFCSSPMSNDVSSKHNQHNQPDDELNHQKNLKQEQGETIDELEDDSHPLNQASGWEKWLYDLERYAEELDRQEAESPNIPNIGTGTGTDSDKDTDTSILGYGDAFDHAAIYGGPPIALLLGAAIGLKGTGLNDPKKKAATKVVLKAFSLATFATFLTGGIVSMAVAKYMDVSNLAEFAQKMSKIVPSHTETLPNKFKPIRDSAETLFGRAERVAKYTDMSPPTIHTDIPINTNGKTIDTSFSEQDSTSSE